MEVGNQLFIFPGTEYDLSIVTQLDVIVHIKYEKNNLKNTRFLLIFSFYNVIF